MIDVMNPDRVIAGSRNKPLAQEFLDLIKHCLPKENINSTGFIHMNESDAEAVKLFSNTSLALRVAFFNELDTFCMKKKLHSHEVIEGVSLDKRIGGL